MNPQGEQTNKITYDAFGSTINGSIDEDMPFGYNGKMIDPATGCYNYGFRDYTPVMQRFTTIDPIKDGSSWYDYCANDPVNFVDLWGLCAESAGEGKNFIQKYFDYKTQKRHEYESTVFMILKHGKREQLIEA